MKNHQDLFDTIKVMLSKHFREELREFEDGNYLAIGDTGIWISVDEMELAVGYGVNHRHYLSEKEFISKAVNDFFCLLTKKKRITEFYKGKTPYKIKTEVERIDGSYTVLSTSIFWVLAFWKKTETMVTIDAPLLEYSVVEKDLLEIQNAIQQWP